MTGVMYGHVTSSQKKGCTQLGEPLLGMVYYYWLGHINQKNDEKNNEFSLGNHLFPVSKYGC